MNLRVLGVYREVEFSPGKTSADSAIIDAVLGHLRVAGAETTAIDAVRFISDPLPDVHMVLAMCQGSEALRRLAAIEESGAVTLNSALAIRNCYRDLLGAGLMRAGVPVPEGALVRTSTPLDMKQLRTLNLTAPMYVKRGEVHALGPEDVSRVDGLEQLQETLVRFSRRGVPLAYVQQEAVGEVVKFYGVGGGAEYFTLIPGRGRLTRPPRRACLIRRVSPPRHWASKYGAGTRSCEENNTRSSISMIGPVSSESAKAPRVLSRADACECFDVIRRAATSRFDGDATSRFD